MLKSFLKINGNVIFIYFLITIPMLIFSQNLVSEDSNKLSNCIIENGLHFLETAYKAGTLDVNTEEKLVYYTDKFDCVTFVEYVLAISIDQLKPQNSKDLNCEQVLTKIRYLNGKIDGYGSRLHYFTQWISEQEKNGWLTDVTKSLGGIPIKKKINFMSNNLNKYPKLKISKDRDKILSAEKALDNYVRYYIPKEKVKKVAPLINSGDIIAITTSVEGLDVVHTGIAIKVNEHLHLLHASETEKKVVISKKTLHDYVAANKNQSGIIVLRGSL